MLNTSTDIAVDLPATAAGPRLARLAVGRLHVDRTQAATVALLTSELVTNAVRYARHSRTIRLAASVRAGGLVLSVTDDEARTAPPVAPCADAEDYGHGLFLVERLAARWGVADATVWFELSPPPQAPAPPPRFGSEAWRDECAALATACLRDEALRKDQ